ncbi:MAG: phenylalanine--tRNA ligase subunit alpha [Nitrospinae bacterium]|nr:phenylalanine--tRNA ligase subunit alpha [Nitrospinota bacterium]
MTDQPHDPELVPLRDKTLAAITAATDSDTLEQIRVSCLGKKGSLTGRLKELGKLPAEARPAAGAAINEVKDALEEALAARGESLKQAELALRLTGEPFDITPPGRGFPAGAPHPVADVMEELIDIFTSLGFAVEEGPEVETDRYNFQMLNFPDDHPARDMQDTFYVQDGRRLLRTHTSPVQVHAMLKRKPPLAVIAPGRVYRCDSDVTHSPVFHQVEGFLVDRRVTMGHLKATLELFVQRLYGRQTKIRLRPSFFPFTEPSAEVDVSCVLCGAKGCRVCKQTGWLEILGAGMIDPNVLTACEIDPEVWGGFAFGLGVERIAMLKYGIDDIRLLYENDPRFLGQFA